MANGNYKNGNGNGKPLEEYTREELIELAKKLRRKKKFGLVWEDKPEDVAVQCETELPVLEQDAKRVVEKAPDQPTNFIIEGDNYHALSVLNYTHAGKIDVIYIDPPYNTGAQDWKYNNNYVDSNDTFRHSKWLSMMQKRLRLAKTLLKEDGVLICAIDDNEQAHLGVLLEELFPAHERHCITVIHNPGGVQGKNFSYNHEYAYFVFPAGKKFIELQNREDRPDIRPLRDVSTGNHLRINAKNCFYPIYVKDEKIIGFGDVSPDSFHPKSANVMRKDGVMEIYPIDPQGNERKWVFARQSVEKIKDELFIEYNRQRKIWDVIRKKTRFNYKTVWDDKLFNANLFGTQLLTKIIKTKFSFPKSLYLVRECIAAVNHKKNGIVLDFFAGSGTTGHAVLALNKEDGGNRQFILCTNNENGIAEEVTYPRIKKVIDGVKELPDITGIPANVRYFKTAFVPRDEVSDNARRALVKKSTKMICVRENTFTKKYDNKEFKIYTNGKINTGVLFDLENVTDFKKKLDALGLPAHIYVFSLSNDDHTEDFENLEVDHTLCPIPESILEVYRRLFGDQDKDE